MESICVKFETSLYVLGKIQIWSSLSDNETKKMFFNLLLTCWGQYRVDGGAGGIFRVPGPEVAASCPVALNRAGIPAVHVLHGCVGSQRLQSNASFGTIVWNKRRHCLNISLVVYYGPLFFVQRTIPAVHFS